ncbi:hypothetical protein [Egicoccus sp. AB-alg2]|uniref:hypothetical protein n=1 Tax=Egicoccus sp. AB-alg2 TaxID=3242693 RepID=UPI00359CF679
MSFPRRARPGVLLLSVLVAVVVVAALLVGAAGPAVATTSSPLPSHVHDEALPGPIDAPAPREYQRECHPEPQPGVEAFRDLVLDAYRGRDGGIVRACDVGGRSEHKEGRGWDWMLDASDPADAAAAAEVLDWLLATDEDGNAHAMARRLGVMYVIWDGEIWSAARAGEGWRPYHGASPHTDHVHFSFSWAGARQETSFWQPLAEEDVRLAGAADEGPGWRTAAVVVATLGVVAATHRRRRDEAAPEVAATRRAQRP